MKKNIVFLVMFSLIAFYSCNDSLEDIAKENSVSRVTYYVNFTFNGDQEQVVSLGSSYSDPGVIATAGEEDVTDSVITEGTVDTSTPGLYKISYTAKNSDGFDSTVTRFVIVTPDNLSSADLSGVYTGQRAGKAPVADSCIITKISEGVFKATDFFGGYYAIGLGYGSAYALPTYFYLKADNTYIAVDTNSAWGPWAVENGVYNPSTGSLNHNTIAYQFGGFGFNVTLTK